MMVTSYLRFSDGFRACTGPEMLRCTTSRDRLSQESNQRAIAIHEPSQVLNMVGLEEYGDVEQNMPLFLLS